MGGGSLTVRLLGQKEPDEAERAASYSLTFAAAAALTYSLLCLVFMDPLLRLLGASGNTIGYARQYLLFVSVIGGVPTVLALNIPLLFLLNRFFGMSGIVWTQATADFLNVIVSYIIYYRVIGGITSG